jgi:hypothetical protein
VKMKAIRKVLTMGKKRKNSDVEPVEQAGQQGEQPADVYDADYGTQAEANRARTEEPAKVYDPNDG